MLHSVFSYELSLFIIFLYTYIQRFSVRYLKKSELLNRLCSFMDQFVCYIYRKDCSYPVFNIFAQYVWKILPILSPDMSER